MVAAASEVQVDEVRLEGGFVKASFAGLDLIILEEKGLMNASHLCQQKGKTLDLYRRTRAQEPKLESTRLYDLNPLLDGTYLPPWQLLDVAAWLAPQTYVGAAVIVEEFFNKTYSRRYQLYLYVSPKITSNEPSPVYCTIQFSSVTLQVDKRGWFLVTDSVCAPEQKVDHFEAQPDSLFLLKYFRIVRWSTDLYFYHPLLFLRLVAWRSPTFYKELFGLVFGGPYSLRGPFRCAIAAAGALLNSLPAERLDDKPDDVCEKGRNVAGEALAPEQLQKEVNRLRGELKRQRLANAVLAPFKKKYDEAEKQLQELRRQLGVMRVLGRAGQTAIQITDDEQRP